MKIPTIKSYLYFILLLLLLCTNLSAQKNHFTIYPAPQGEELSKQYQVTAAGKEVPVYLAKIAPEDASRRWKAMDDKKNSAEYFDTGAFAYLDLQGKATFKITVPSKVTSAKILPTSAGITPKITGNTITFSVNSPRNLTIEINGEWVRSVHLFINPPEVNAPRSDDPNVIYFGPGIHEITHLVVGDNKTLYIAGGAVVRAVIKPEENSWISSYSGLRNYSPSIELRGKNITVRGRGILDASGCTTHSRNMMVVHGSNIKIE
jgi:hypothetical protein